MFDLPQPLGPTTAAMPSPERWTSVRSQNDLKPSIWTFLSLSKPHLRGRSQTQRMARGRPSDSRRAPCGLDEPHSFQFSGSRGRHQQYKLYILWIRRLEPHKWAGLAGGGHFIESNSRPKIECFRLRRHEENTKTYGSELLRSGMMRLGKFLLKNRCHQLCGDSLDESTDESESSILRAGRAKHLTSISRFLRIFRGFLQGLQEHFGINVRIIRDRSVHLPCTAVPYKLVVDDYRFQVCFELKVVTIQTKAFVVDRNSDAIFCCAHCTNGVTDGQPSCSPN